jgi:hypothetical protein
MTNIMVGTEVSIPPMEPTENEYQQLSGPPRSAFSIPPPVFPPLLSVFPVPPRPPSFPLRLCPAVFPPWSRAFSCAFRAFYRAHVIIKWCLSLIPVT